MNLTRARAGVSALALILLPSLALAQGTPAYQSGAMVAPHNLAKVTRNGQYQDAGGLTGDATGRGVNPFLILDSLGDAFCADTAARTGTYHSLCIGHNASGNPVFKIDTLEYPFVTSGGNITGPGSAAVGDIALYNSTGGTLLKTGSPGQMTDAISAAVTTDYSTLTVRSVAGLSANTILSEISAAGPNWDGVRSILSVTNGSTSATNSAIAGYAVNNRASSAGLYNAVALIGIAENVVGSAASFGINVVCADKTAGLPSTLCQNEFDFNMRSATAVMTGLAITGAMSVQPASAVGFICESFGAGMLYNSGCLNSSDGVAITGIFLGGGAGAPGAAALSQKIRQTAFTAANTPASGEIYVDNGKAYNMDAPGGGVIILRIGTVPVFEAITATPSAGNTGVSIIYNGTAGVGYSQVAVGAADSCTAGFRCLRVAN